MQLDSILNQLRTGCALTVSESVEIQTDLDSLSKELSRLDALILDFSAQRDRVRESIESHRALIAPIRRLPDDIVQEVFLACLPRHRNAAMSPEEAPLLLCRICSVWRALALATPMLWASLHVQIAFILQREDRMHAVAQWVKRSGGCPLSLSVSGPSPADYPSGLPDPEADEMAPDLLLGTLLQSASRWRDVALNDLPPVYAEQLRGAPTPLLQAIQIRDEQDATQWLNLITSPIIRKVSLEVVIRLDHGPVLLPLLSSVTHLSIWSNPRSPWEDNGIPANLALDILHNLTQLVSLKMKIKPIQLVANQTTHLPFLESFDLRGLHVALPVFDDLLAQLIMPRLRHLCLESSRVDAQNQSVAHSNTPSFASLCKHSPSISSLNINLENFMRDPFRGTLLNFPSLTKLVVQDGSPWSGDDIVNTRYLLTLLAEPTSTSLLPALRALESTYSVNVDDQTLFRFLQTRVDAGGGFKLNLRYHFLGVEGLPDVERFRSEGLDISLSAEQQWVPPVPDAWMGLPSDSVVDD
ncbi:hypothetical protein C8R43DRAFT_1001434 [Mycena crocata]|nr:hypothetical protein C8R43DRAFT_1001434 [Mycena crocata]